MNKAMLGYRPPNNGLKQLNWSQPWKNTKQKEKHKSEYKKKIVTVDIFD